MLLTVKSKYNIVWQTESWLLPGEATEVTISNYKVASHFTRSSFSRGGVIILSTEDNFTCLKDIFKFSEKLTCKVAAVYFKSLDVTVLSFYRSPNGDFKRFLDIFKNIISLPTRSGRVILCGDFNV